MASFEIIIPPAFQKQAEIGIKIEVNKRTGVCT